MLIAFDRDDAGERRRKKAAGRLMARGVDCLRVQFPHGQDANEYAQSHRAREILGLLLRSALWIDGSRRRRPCAARPVLR